MTDNEITNKETKIKDSAKIERGKQLAAISKQAKEDKMRKRLKEEMDLNPVILTSKTGYAVGAIGILSALGVISYEIYSRKGKSKSVEKPKPQKVEDVAVLEVETKVKPKVETKTNSRLVSF